MPSQKTVTMFASTFFVLWTLVYCSVAAGTEKVPQRSDIDAKYKWKVEDIYSDLGAWEADFAGFRDNMARMEQFKGNLGESADQLLNCLQLSDSLGLIGENLYVYAYLKLDEDNRESQFQELGGRISALSAKFSEATSFIEPEILDIDSDKLLTMLGSNPELDQYRFYLEDMIRQKEHILDADKEELLALADPVASAPSQIFSMITDADVTFGSIFDEDSNQVKLTRGRYYKFLESSDRRVRRDANQTYNKAYLAHVNSLAATLSASVKRDYFYMKARGYSSCLEMSLAGDNIPVDVFYNLIDAVNSNLAPLHKWASMRKKLLGVDTLYSYDMWVPILPEMKRTYEYEEAREMNLSGLKPMGDKYLAEFAKGLDGGWIDVFETEGKGSGAYQWGTYATHPFVLLNYNGQLDNVFTLAHEMGHAMHSFYTQRNEPYIYGDHSLFVAEVASTCNEAVLMKYMFRNAKTKEEKIGLLNYYIEQIIGTFYTQVMFSEFERAIHDRIEKGDAFSADYFRKTYRDIYQKYWGPELVIDSVNDLGCLRIGHFYRQFYVYQYATCYSAAQMLSQKILDGGKDDLETYLRFLSTGSSKYPVDVLKDAGVDMTSPEPINRTINLFAELVDQMEELLAEN
ncbi:MAG: oligoendopeptidase F [Candidatus Zixiibacteriota bacterium]